MGVVVFAVVAVSEKPGRAVQIARCMIAALRRLTV
jgi:hypothetical protein